MGVCGYGWETPADARLEFDYDGTVIFHDGTGAPSYFESLPVDGPVMEPVDGGTLHQIDDYYAVRLKGGLTYYFAIPKEPVEEVVVEYVMDLCKNYLKYVRDENGLREIVESAGRRIEVTSENGLIKGMRLLHPEYEKPHPLVRFEYGENGDLITVLDALDHPYRFKYQNHRLIQHMNRNGLSFYYEYDEYNSNGRCHHTWGDGGLYNYHFKYHDLEGRTEVTNSLGHTSTTYYNNRCQIVKDIDPLGGITEYAYDEAGRTTMVTNPAGNCSEYKYDARGNLLRLVRPDGKAIGYEFNTLNKEIRRIDPNGASWEQEWNGRGLLTSQKSPLDALSQYGYDEHGQLVYCVNPIGAMTKFRFDAHGNLIQVTDPRGFVSTLRYDIFGNVIKKNDPLGHATYYQYDAKSRLVQVVFPSGAKKSFSYDPEGNLTMLNDKNGKAIRLDYCGLGEIKRKIQPDGHLVEYHYDSEERLISITNQRGEVYAFERDLLGQIVKETDFWNHVKRYKYNLAGHIEKIADPLGKEVTYETDSLGRIVKKTFQDPIDSDTVREELFTYDDNSNLIGVENDATKIARYFDADNRLVKEIQGDHTVLYTYDANSNLKLRVTSYGNRVAFQYDAADNAVAVTINNNNTIAIERNVTGLPIKESLSGSSLIRQYSYDVDGRLLRQQIGTAVRSVAERQYQYDAASNLLIKTDAAKGRDEYIYDPMGRLIEHINPEGRVEELLYDPAGDLLKPAAQTSSQDRILVHKNTVYTFDATGNLIERIDDQGRTTFEWDCYNRLCMAIINKDSTLSTLTMAYDALGRRIRKQHNDKLTFFAWDGDRLLSEQTQGDGVREYVYYPDSFEPLAVIDANKQVFFIHNDHIGLPHEVTDRAGNIVWSARYDSMAKVDKLFVSNFHNPIRMQGQYADNEIGIYYNRNRYYDPHIGAFISQDPLGLDAGLNLYRYAPNVWKWVDPLGLTCVSKRKVKDLKPLHSDDTIGPRPDLQKLSDDELLNSVNNPKNSDFLKENTKTGKLQDGNSRARELQRRANNPNSKITPDTEVPVESYTPDNSMFWDLD
jgi:RHS repeat-associated protein